MLAPVLRPLSGGGFSGKQFSLLAPLLGAFQVVIAPTDGAITFILEAIPAIDFAFDAIPIVTGNFDAIPAVTESMGVIP